MNIQTGGPQPLVAENNEKLLSGSLARLRFPNKPNLMQKCHLHFIIHFLSIIQFEHTAF